MSVEITRETATATNGDIFDVNINRFPNMPPVVVCDGSGIKCPFRGVHHSSVPTCQVVVKSHDGLMICGKVTEPD